MRMLKAEMFRAMRACYEAHRQRFAGRHAAAFSAPFNNARLALAAAYTDYTPAFAELFRLAGQRLAGVLPSRSGPRQRTGR